MEIQPVLKLSSVSGTLNLGATGKLGSSLWEVKKVGGRHSNVVKIEKLRCNFLNTIVDLRFEIQPALKPRKRSCGVLLDLKLTVIHTKFAYLSREPLLSTHADSAYEVSTIAYHDVLELVGVDSSR